MLVLLIEDAGEHSRYHTLSEPVGSQPLERPSHSANLSLLHVIAVLQGG